MPTWGWVAVALGLVALWYFYTHRTVSGNSALGTTVGNATARYTTDIMGLIGAFDSSSDSSGSFASRLGNFFGALPT